MTRVKVWVDAETPLGEGELVGKVPLVDAYEVIYKTIDVNILQEKYCLNIIAVAANHGILPPPPDKLPKIMKKMLNNFNLATTPKIVLDTGEVVYGCQIWWKEV